MVKPRVERLMLNQSVVRACDRDNNKTVFAKEQIIVMGARTKGTPEEFLRGKNCDQSSKESTEVSSTATTATATVAIVNMSNKEDVTEVQNESVNKVESPSAEVEFAGLVLKNRPWLKLSLTRSSLENEIEESSSDGGMTTISKKGKGKINKKKMAVSAEIENSESESKGDVVEVEVENEIKETNNKKKNARLMRERKLEKRVSDQSKTIKKGKDNKGKAKKPPTAPARVSPRLNGRKNSGSVNLEPLQERIRFHDLITRSVELRDPATMLLFMAGLGLFPKSDLKCDTTPTIIIEKEITSPGGQTTKRELLEVPLMPDWMNLMEEPEDCQRSEDGLLLQIAPTSSSSLPLSSLYEEPASPPEPIAKKISNRKSPSPPVVTPPVVATDEEREPPIKKIKPRPKPKPKVLKKLETKQGTDVESLQQSLPSASPVVSDTSDQPSLPEASKLIAGLVKQNPSPIPKKRKSLETITREIAKNKAESAVLPLQIDESVKLPLRIDVPSENKPEKFPASIPHQGSQPSPPASQSSNPILLEELMKKPVRKRAPKRKLASATVTDLTEASQMANIQIPESMTVPVQPDSVLPVADMAFPLKWNNTRKEPVKPRNKKSTPLFPPPMRSVLPVPLGFSNYVSIPPNNELTMAPKPQQPKKTRVKKTEGEAVVSSVPQNTLGYLMPMAMDNTQYPISSPYHPALPSHREFRVPPLSVALPPLAPLASPNHPDPDVALDFRMKTLGAAYHAVQTKKSPKGFGIPQSILKPISEIAMNDDSPFPLDLAVNRPELSIRLASKPPAKENGSEPLKPLPDNVTVINGLTKTQTSLDNFKQRLARLDTNIAPAVFNIE